MRSPHTCQSLRPPHLHCPVCPQGYHPPRVAGPLPLSLPLLSSACGRDACGVREPQEAVPPGATLPTQHLSGLAQRCTQERREASCDPGLSTWLVPPHSVCAVFARWGLRLPSRGQQPTQCPPRPAEAPPPLLCAPPSFSPPRSQRDQTPRGGGYFVKSLALLEFLRREEAECPGAQNPLVPGKNWARIPGLPRPGEPAERPSGRTGPPRGVRTRRAPWRWARPGPALLAVSVCVPHSPHSLLTGRGGCWDASRLPGTRGAPASGLRVREGLQSWGSSGFLPRGSQGRAGVSWWRQGGGICGQR